MGLGAVLDVYRRISVLGDKNIRQQWVRVGMVSRKYHAGPVLNLGCVSSDSIY
jgi:hypothetical protein